MSSTRPIGNKEFNRSEKIEEITIIQKKTTTIAELPEDLLLKIFKCIGPTDTVLTLTLVCKDWNRLKEKSLKQYDIGRVFWKIVFLSQKTIHKEYYSMHYKEKINTIYNTTTDKLKNFKPNELKIELLVGIEDTINAKPFSSISPMLISFCGLGCAYEDNIYYLSQIKEKFQEYYSIINNTQYIFNCVAFISFKENFIGPLSKKQLKILQSLKFEFGDYLKKTRAGKPENPALHSLNTYHPLSKREDLYSCVPLSERQDL